MINVQLSEICLTSVLSGRKKGIELPPPIYNILIINNLREGIKHVSHKASLVANVIKIFLAFVFVCPTTSVAQSQSRPEIAFKSNILYDAIATPNIGIEIKTAPQWTFEVTGNLNCWNINNRRWKQLSIQPEVRYWLCESYSGHFFGAHLIGGQYNFGNLPVDFAFLGTHFSVLQENRLQGWMGGAGLAYGYSWILGKHWNLEAELGFGWIYTRYDKFKCATCSKKLETKHPHNYVGPTKAAINLVYLF